MTKCQHRYIVDPPHGPTSWGECEYCHDRREFENTLPDSPVVGGLKKGRQHPPHITHTAYDYDAIGQVNT